MQEISAVMRSIELYRISAENKLRKSFNDLTSSTDKRPKSKPKSADNKFRKSFNDLVSPKEKRPKFYSTQNLASTSSSPSNRQNFRRNYQKKRNSADVERILAKYAHLRHPNSMPSTTPNISDINTKDKNYDEIKCVIVKEKEIGTKYNNTNLTDSDKIALRPKSNQSDIRPEKGSASQKFEKYQRRVKSVFIVGSEKELWKFKSSDNVSKVDVIPEEIDEIIARGESHSNLFEKCNSSVYNRSSCSANNTLQPVMEEGERFHNVPKRWKSEHFTEESILTRPPSGVWEVPRSKTLMFNNMYKCPPEYFNCRVKSGESCVPDFKCRMRKGESCMSLNSTKKWWKSRFGLRKRVYDRWLKWRRRKVENNNTK